MKRKAEMETGKTHDKVWAAASGGGIGAPLGVILVAVIQETIWTTMPGEVDLAIIAVVTFISSWAVGYIKRPSPRDQIQMIAGEYYR